MSSTEQFSAFELAKEYRGVTFVNGLRGTVYVSPNLPSTPAKVNISTAPDQKPSGQPVKV